MDRSIVDKLSATSEVQRDHLFRWLADQGDTTRWEAAKLQTELATRNRHKYDKEHRAEFYYAMLARAVFKLHWIETAQAKKTSISSEEAAELTVRRLQRVKELRKWRKGSFKKEIIRSRFYELIRFLRAEGLSWKQVELYLKKFHRAEISFTYLKKVYEEIEREKEEAEAET